MSPRLRIAALVLALCTVSHAATAGIITRTGENSFLIYGGPTAYYFGNGINFPIVPAYDPEGDDTAFAEFSITTGPLAATSFTAETSTYQYDGGELMMWVQSPIVFGGFFFADVLDLTITVVEHDDAAPPFDSDDVTVAFRLGAGGFEAPGTMPIGFNRTRGGSVVDQWLYGYDSPSDAERFAREGLPELTLEVPEPSLLALLAFGVGMSTPIIAKRARSRRRT